MFKIIQFNIIYIVLQCIDKIIQCAILIVERRYAMEQSTLSIRINSSDKINFEKFCSETGMNVSVAINMFIKAVLRDQKLPFEIKTYSFDNYVYDKLREAENEINNKTLRYSSDEIFSNLKDICIK